MFSSLFSCCSSAANRPIKPTTLPPLDSASTVEQSPQIDQFASALRAGLLAQDQQRRLDMQLVHAIDHGTSKKIQQALDKGADANATIQEQHLGMEFTTPLQLAAWRGDAGAIQLLLQHGALASKPNGVGMTPMHFAVESGSVDGIEALLAGGAQASINQPDENGNTPLHDAAGHGSKEVVEVLLKNGALASLNQPNTEGDTPLQTALKSNANRDTLLVFLAHGAHPASLSTAVRQQWARGLNALLKEMLVKLNVPKLISYQQEAEPLSALQVQVCQAFGAVHRFAEAGIALDARSLKRIQKKYNQTLKRTNQLVAQSESRVEKLKLIGKTLPILRSGVPLDQELLNKLAENARETGYLDGLVAATEAGASRSYLGRYVAEAPKVKAKSPFVKAQ